MTARPSAVTLDRQARASDPASSAWVSANAGSGKTYVLVQRVVRLLLSGADPSRILCLTFTKAAAANMQNRVVERLRGWATAPADALATEIAALDGAQPSPARLAQARKLFARALETPGGLKIYTIHAFCGRLLHQFPFEANVAAGFSELDDRDQAELKAEARAKTLAQAVREPDGPIGQALAYLAARFHELTIYGALDHAMAKRHVLTALLRSAGVEDVAGVARELRRTLNLSPDETEAALEAAILADGISAAEWPAFAAELRLGSPNDVKLGDCFAAAARANSLADRRAAYLSAFFTQAGPPKKSLVTAATRKAKPVIADVLDAELARLSTLVPKLSAAAMVARTQALATLADAASNAYSAAKSARGMLDYDDLIARTRDLLSRTDAQWVLFKLDGGLDHILVDEAQDTSPEQWDIIARLTDDFLRGASASPRERTVFAVGDEKQSIFGFQGAEPASFGEARRRYGLLHREAELGFEDVRLTESFRSTEAVLNGVDAVFARPEAHRGLVSEEDARTLHQTTRATAPGSVELWPIVMAEQGTYAEEAWDAPFDRVNPRSAVVRLAEKIAEAIVAAHRDDGVPYGEILVLVRQRKALFEAILRTLKARGAPVAGADRLVVGEHIAVMDLMALARALTTPDDDLSLACALKSPLFGLDDDDLMAVAPGRDGRRLIDALADGPPRAKSARGRLETFAREARTRTPFGFFAHILAKAGGRKAFRARLGSEADDPLDAFLDLAQDFGRTHPPTLPGFLRWMAAAPAEIKRDLDVASGEVRVMTVHGAKGLEAKLVVLADTTGGATAGRGFPLIMLPRPHAGHGAPPTPVWAGKKSEDPEPLRAAREGLLDRAEAEHRRLLYVALTRAEDRLIVCGHETTRARPDGAWYDLVKDGLSAHPDVQQIENDDGVTLRLRSGEATGGAVEPTSPEAPQSEAAPPWLEASAPFEAAPGPPLSPSALVAEDAEGAPALGGPAAEAARLRGSLLHRLLKALPDVAPERRADVAARILLGAGTAIDAEAQAEIAASALGILEDPAFADVFAPGGLGEVPVVGKLRDGRPVSGRIDRLAVTEDDVLVIDYKTDRRPPPPDAPVPPAYAAQLAAYVELVSAIWPGRRVRGAILWTSAPRLDLLSAPLA
jgi:ATP-dependent helicase/nuclease subunit A